MSAPSRARNQQKAVEHKKALFEKMRSTLGGKKAPAPANAVATPEAITAKVPDSFPSRARPTPVQFGAAGVRLYQDHAETPLVATEALARLVNVYLEAACNRTAHQVLMWPVAPQVLPLVHVLATMEYWSAGRKAGMRGLFFPANRDTFHPLNHLDLDRSDIARHAQELVKLKCVTDKDPVYFRAANTAGAFPTINDLIPHFAALWKGETWPPYDDRLLEHTLKKVNRYSEKAALRSNCAGLGAPRTAPDALFAFGYQLDRDSLRESFRNLKKVGSPDVCLVNATRALRLNLPTWQGAFKQFVGAYLETYPDERPGLVVVTDDPGVGFRIRELVEKEVERATKHRPHTAPLHFIFNPIVCQDGRELGQCLKPEGSSEPAAPQPRKFLVEVKDADAARVVKSMYQVRQELKIDEQAARPLTDAATFLHKLAALPAGNRDVEAWLDERQADAELRRKLAWTSPRGALVEFVAKGQGKPLDAKIGAAIKTADKLVANYYEATPMAMAMASEVASASNGTRTALVFTRPIFLMLAERFLRRQSLPGGKSFTDPGQRFQLILTKQLRAHARTGWATRYVFVGIDDDALRALMTEDGIPADSLLLLTLRTALYARWSLKPIYEQSEFRRFKPRLEHILRQLEGRLNAQDVPLLRSDDFVLPTFDFSSHSQTRDDDPDAWRILLEEGEPLFRSPTTTVYVYDPMADIQSKSGFTPREVKSLEPGHELFVMSNELREQVEHVLQRAGVPIEHDKPFEQTLRMYHETIVRKLNELFPGKSLSAQVVLLKDELIRQAPDLAKDFSNVRHWVNLGHAIETPFEELRPQAPRHFKVFAAFASALGLSGPEVAYFWQAAIHPIRVNRRIDGRYVSDVYARILFDPESAIVHANLSASDIANLFTEARRNVHTVLAIEPPAITRSAA